MIDHVTLYTSSTSTHNTGANMTLLFLFACLFKPQPETNTETPNVEIVYAEIEINGELAY